MAVVAVVTVIAIVTAVIVVVVGAIVTVVAVLTVIAVVTVVARGASAYYEKKLRNRNAGSATPKLVSFSM